PHPLDQLAEEGARSARTRTVRRRRRQEGFVLLERQRAEVNPELALMVPHPRAQNRTRPEEGTVAAQVGALARGQPQPMAHELLDPRGHAEELAKDRRQAVGV